MFLSNNIRSTSNVDTADLLAFLNSKQLEEETFQLKSVYRKNSQQWDLLVGKVERCKPNSEETLSIEYSDYFFLEKELTFAQLTTMIANIEETQECVLDASLGLILNAMANKWRWELIPSHATPERFPVRRYSLELSNHTSFSDTPLVGFGKKYYQSVQEYIRTFLKQKDFSGEDNSISGSLLLDVYDYRHRIITENSTLFFEPDDPHVCLVGNSPKEEYILLHHGERLAFDSEDVYDAELLLISKANEILDYRSQSTWQYPIKRPESDTKFLEECQKAIDNGEGLYCEFKPFIDIKAENSKAFEIEKTVCAFSNAEGGQLFIGVNDDGEVIGIAEKAKRTYGSKIEDAISSYCDGLRKRLNETLKVNHCYTLEPLTLYTKQIIVISVSQANDANYLLNQKQGYKRKGATSAKMAFIEERNTNIFGS